MRLLIKKSAKGNRLTASKFRNDLLKNAQQLALREKAWYDQGSNTGFRLQSRDSTDASARKG